jgi:uncharacterized membrane protein YdjX (TVP38/TMEM64 family)
MYWHKYNVDLKILRIIFKGLVMFCLIGGPICIIKWTALPDAFNINWFDVNIRGKGFVGGLIYFGIATFFMAIGMPRQIICFFGGYCFGVPYGTGLTILSSGLSCLVVSICARFFGRRIVVQRYGKKIQKIDNLMSQNPFSIALAIRLFPVGNNFVANLISGVSGMPIFPFVAGSIVGYFPQTIVFVLYGSGVNLSSAPRLILSLFLFIISSTIGIFIYQKTSRTREMRTMVS